MRLLHTIRLEFEEFYESKTPKYAILSHTWSEGQEITYQDMLVLIDDCQQQPPVQSKRCDALKIRTGYCKIMSSRKQALQDGLEWLWVDTCNIDKSSSAELSEAINSMFKWYKNSEVCYAYLADVEDSSPGRMTQSTSQGCINGAKLVAFEESVWFTRSESADRNS
jgi:hypothetical protein